MSSQPVPAVADLARAARLAAVPLALAGRATKDAALRRMAAALREHTDDILQANKEDVVRAEAGGTEAAMIDRLRLDAGRIDAMAAGLEQLASLPDPIGEVIRGSVTDTGLRLEQVRVPLGVIGIIYEGRPNVTADAAGICLKSGNACLLRGSSSAADSNTAIISVLRSAIESAGLPADCITGVGGDRETVKELMQARGLVDLLIPRGGAGLIQTVVRESTVPVIETGVGNVHIFVDATADLAKALPIILNAKTQRPSVCNAAETLLIHRDIAATFVPTVTRALTDAGVTIHADAAFAAAAATKANPAVVPATTLDFDTEYLSLDIAAAVVDDLAAAIEHIRVHTTGHTEVILTESVSAADTFVAQVDAGAVIVNASSRFTDGGEFGFGAEIGISTQKMHARGPMGLAEMTSTKWIVRGDGHVRA
jgi:glutamate-5-semialdehyde dehydrogenase